MTAVAERLRDDISQKLAELGSATLYEATGSDCALSPKVKAMWPGAKVVGRALPVRTHPADNLAIHRAVAVARPGDVLVVDGRGELCGYWGEVLAVAARAAGVVGLVIDGGVRDVAGMRGMDFPVFALGAALHRTGKHWPGQVGAPIEVGNVVVHLGDVVVADEDGVVVLPSALVEDILEAGERRAAQEAQYMELLQQGRTTLEVYGFSTE